MREVLTMVKSVWGAVRQVTATCYPSMRRLERGTRGDKHKNRKEAAGKKTSRTITIIMRVPKLSIEPRIT